MKFKTTLVLLAGFLVLLAFILFLDKKPKESGTAGGQDKLLTLKAADIEKISIKRDGETLTFKKDEKGDWMVTEPIEVKADNSEVGQVAEMFADLNIDRVVEKEKADPKKYEIPKKEVALWSKGQAQPVRVLFGMENPIGGAIYAQKDGDPRVVLLTSTLKSMLDKKLFDFRQKDVFKYDTADVAGVNLQAKDVSWQAQKKDDDWWLDAPVKALATASKVTNVLDMLSNMRAKEFVAENKTPADLKKFGLDKPEVQVVLAMPKSGKEIVVSLHKDDKEGKTYVTTSPSTKIIVPESDLLADLGKKPDEYREKKVAVFSSWQATKVALKKDTVSLAPAKSTNDKWYLDAALKEEADATKIETFLRKVENLEAAEFLDAPKALAEYGLDKPQAEVTVTTKETGEKAVEKSVTILVGTSDKDKKQVVVKNSRFAYLFRVDSGFLDDFPKEAKDWKVAAPEPEKKEPAKK
jgi:hypothetical protein